MLTAPLAGGRVRAHMCRQIPNKPATAEGLSKLGILAWKLDPTDWESDPKLAAIRKVRSYSYHVRRGVGRAARLAPTAAVKKKGKDSSACPACGPVVWLVIC